MDKLIRDPETDEILCSWVKPRHLMYQVESNRLLCKNLKHQGVGVMDAFDDFDYKHTPEGFDFWWDVVHKFDHYSYGKSANR